MKTLLITDLDNTVYNWVDYFAPSFRGMVHALARELDVTEQRLYDDFREVFKEHNSLEYSFSVQNLSICRHLSEERLKEIIDLAKRVFSQVRQKNLVPYAGVEETLSWMCASGVVIVGVTNATVYHAEMRLRQLRLDKYYAGLSGLDSSDVPSGPYTEEISNKKKQGAYNSRIKRIWACPVEELKPAPFAYLKVIEELGISHKDTYVVGDSIGKDIAPALDVGAIAIWARYGTKFTQENFDTLLKITPWSDERISTTYHKRVCQPNHTIDSFSELKRIVKTPQLHFGFGE